MTRREWEVNDDQIYPETNTVVDDRMFFPTLLSNSDRWIKHHVKSLHWIVQSNIQDANEYPQFICDVPQDKESGHKTTQSAQHYGQFLAQRSSREVRWSNVQEEKRHTNATEERTKHNVIKIGTAQKEIASRN